MAKREILEWIKALIADVENPVIFELGANTGSDTVKLAAIKGATVHAFEPEPRCKLAGLPANVVLNRVAVSDTIGEAVFNQSDSPGHTGNYEWTYSSSLLSPKTHLTVHKHVKFERKVKVKTTTLDAYCREKGIARIDFLWMDVQGAEAKVFAGAGRILKNTRFIYTEYSNNEMYEGQKPLIELLAMLGTFTVIDVWPVETSNVLLRNNFNHKPEAVVRIDDFPTGVRPVLNDLSMFFRVFDEFEKNKITFHLGIVPEVFRLHVSQQDKEKLLGYNYLVPCQHGFEHRYAEMSEKIIKANDLLNTKTVGVFDEFEGKNKEHVRANIVKGKHYLEHFFGTKITGYIPVCDFTDNILTDVLKEEGYEAIYTIPVKKAIPGLVNIVTEYSGRIDRVVGKKNDGICLHITWECDYINENGWDKWLANFNSYFNIKAAPAPDPVTVIEPIPDPVVETVKITVAPEEIKKSIPPVANFFWNAETPLSYLRYLSFASFRHHHPGWEVNLYLGKTNIGQKWNDFPAQDFQNKYAIKDYLAELIKLDVNILHYKNDLSQTLAPTFVADIIRFELLKKGGWFFDNDQVFLRPFDPLNTGHDFITGCEELCCIGVIGATEGCGVVNAIIEKQHERLAARNNNPDRYCLLGNWVIIDMMKTQQWGDLCGKFTVFNTPSRYFYPVYNSETVQANIRKKEFRLPVHADNYAFHWFGGHPLNQKFNSGYTEEFAQKSTDIMSVYMRKEGIV